MCALTLEIPKSGQDNTEAYSKVGGTGTYGDVWGRQPGENISPDTALWGGRGRAAYFTTAHPGPKGSTGSPGYEQVHARTDTPRTPSCSVCCLVWGRDKLIGALRRGHSSVHSSGQSKHTTTDPELDWGPPRLCHRLGVTYSSSWKKSRPGQSVRDAR